MKFKLPLVLLFGMAAFTAKAQLVVGTTTPIDASAILQAVSTNKGFLPPIMTNTQMNAISNPATGLIVFNTTILSLMMNIGTGASPNWTNGASTLYNADGTLLANRTVWQSGNYLQFTGTGQIYFNSGAVNFNNTANLATANFANVATFNGSSTFNNGVYFSTGAPVTFGSVATFNSTSSFNNPVTFSGSATATFNGYSNFNYFTNFAAGLTGTGNFLQNNTVGIGIRADGGLNMGQNTTGHMVAIGYTAGQNTYGTNNQFIGYQAGYQNTSGFDNTFEGNHAGVNNTVGNDNVYVGNNAAANAPRGVLNVIIGSGAAQNFSEGAGNVFIGGAAGMAHVIGNMNVALGYQSGPANNALYNTIAIGYNATTYSDNNIRLGDNEITSFRCQVGLSVSSDARFKYQVKENVPGLAFIQKLRPVSYRFDNKKLAQYEKDGIEKPGFNEDATAPIQTGFLAQDVEKLVQELGVTFDGVLTPTNKKDHYSLAYAQFVMPLVKGMQEQQAIIEKLMARIEKLEQQQK